jgi:uncharacterized BrkB/YihY/UPF0761 family membrane protein
MEYSNDLRIKTSHYIIMGFSIVVGLSWNETMRQLINDLFPVQSDAVLIKIMYSLFLTFMLVLVIKFLPDTSKEVYKNMPRRTQQFH